MADNGLTASAEFLRNAAAEYFRNLYENPIIEFEKELDSTLSWAPSVHLKPLKHLTIAVEVSETPYPRILRMRHADILQVPFPISVFCACPEESFLSTSAQKDVRELQAHGYGLLTIDTLGNVTKRHGCVPLIQYISEGELNKHIVGLPKSIRLEVKQAYESYMSKPTSGIKDLSEVIESMIIDSGKKVLKKGWINPGDVKDTVSNLLQALDNCQQCASASAAIGGAKSFISVYRNSASHTPKSKKQAYVKYQDCQHAFREGVRVITRYRESMKTLGISISI